MLHTLLNLEPGYSVILRGDFKYGEEYVCDTDELIEFAKEVESLLKEKDDNTHRH